MTTPLPPTSPSSVFGAQAMQGELMLTQDRRLVMWDGSSWVDADLQPVIFGEDPRFEKLQVERLNAGGIDLPVRYGADLTADPAQVEPGKLYGGQFQAFDLDGARQPGVQLSPAIFTEADQSALASALVLLGTSPDTAHYPTVYLWTKQAGAVNLGVVTDATGLMENAIYIDSGGVTMLGSAGSAIQMVAPEVDLYATNVFLTGNTYMGGAGKTTQINGRISQSGTGFTMWRFSQTGAVAYVQITFGATMDAIPAVVGQIDTAAATGVTWTFSFASTTGCRVYCSNWTAVTTEWVNFAAAAYTP